MLTKFKLWLYYFFTERLLKDDQFIGLLFNRLKEEQKLRDNFKEVARLAAADARRRLTCEQNLADIKKYQDACTHLKGMRGPAIHSDYAISDHTFTDGTRKVRCLVCSKTWAGEQLKSPEVIHMLQNTTNSRSSSEVSHCSPVDRVNPCDFDSRDRSCEKEDEEWENNPLHPFASRGYVKRWDKMYKKLTRKRGIRGLNRIS